MKIRIIKEPTFWGPNYAKESLIGLIVPVDKSAPPRNEMYPIRKELLLDILEKKDPIAYGWWKEHFWPQKDNSDDWVYFPIEACEEIN